MPLVVPGMSSKGGDQTSDWQSKLMGKKIGESTDEVVRAPSISTPQSLPITRRHSPHSSPFPIDSESQVRTLTRLEELREEGSPPEA